MASNTQYQGGGMGKKHMPPLVAKPIITVTVFTPGNTPDRVIIFAFIFWGLFFKTFGHFSKIDMPLLVAKPIITVTVDKNSIVS